MVFRAENTTYREESTKEERDQIAEANARDAAEKAKAVREQKRQEDARTSMTMFEYQSGAVKTAIYPGVGTGNLEALAYLFSLLAAEAGEANGKFGKLLRDGESEPGQARQAVAYELGDVLWSVAQIANELDYSLSDIAKMNLDKLADRQARGVLGGSGDNR